MCLVFIILPFVKKNLFESRHDEKICVSHLHACTREDPRNTLEKNGDTRHYREKDRRWIMVQLRSRVRHPPSRSPSPADKH